MMYLPILKWRQGEYQALLRLDPYVKTQLLPLVEITPIEWDFERAEPAKSLEDHLSRVGQRIREKWGEYRILIDLGLLGKDTQIESGQSALEHVFDLCRSENASAIPVVRIDDSYQTRRIIQKIAAKDQRGVAVRVTFGALATPGFTDNIAGLLNGLKVSYELTDLVIDLGCPNFYPLDPLANALRSRLELIQQIGDFRSIHIASTSFPKSMGSVSRGCHSIERTEWLLYRKLYNLLDEFDSVGFGDYVIAHPELPNFDMRLLRPSANIRYTIDEAWLIAKGTSVRDDGLGQFRGLCTLIVNSGMFFGTSYSRGDEYIADCSAGNERTGNLTTWRWVGTNHHLTKVIDDLAKLRAA